LLAAHTAAPGFLPDDGTTHATPVLPEKRSSPRALAL
jgi:hypothetical protein